MMYNLFTEFDFVTCIEELTKWWYNLQLNIWDEWCVYWELIPAVAWSWIQSIVAGKNIAVDNSDPLNPVVANIFDPLDEYLRAEATSVVTRDNVTLYGINFSWTSVWTSIILNNLTDVFGDINIPATLVRLTDVQMSNLQTVLWNFFLQWWLITSFDLTSLISVWWLLNILNYKWSTIDLPALENVWWFSVQSVGPLFTTCNAPLLQTSGNNNAFNFNVNNCLGFTWVTFPALATSWPMQLQAFWTGTSIFSFPVLTNISSVVPANWNLSIQPYSIKEALFPSLTTITWNLNVATNNDVYDATWDTLDLSSLVSVWWAINIWPSFGTANRSWLVTLNFPSLVSVTSMKITRCISLTTINLSSSITCTYLDFSINALSQASVDDILNKVDIAGQNNWTLRLNQWTNAAPSAAWLVSKANLQGRWRTVTNN